MRSILRARPERARDGSVTVGELCVSGWCVALSAAPHAGCAFWFECVQTLRCERSGGGKDAPEPVSAGLARGLGDRGLREERVEAVESACLDVKLGLASGRPDSRRTGDGLVSEDLGGACVDVGGRQPG